MADHLRTELVIDALTMAARNYPLADGTIFHSDYAELCVKPRDRALACVGGVAWLIPRLNDPAGYRRL